MIKQFTVGASRTVNLGHFESARVEAYVTMEVTDGESLGVLKNAAQQELRLLLEETWKKQVLPKRTTSETA